MCAEQGACVRRRSWAGYTINMFEFEFPTGTGVDGDDELERVGDNELIGADTVALGPGRPIEVAWMKGRSRAYRGADPMAAGQFLSIGFNDQCDVIVALATLGGGDPKAREPAVLAFLNGDRVLRWVKWLLL